MSTPYPGSPVFPPTITTVDGTDLQTAESVSTPLRELADRTAFLLANGGGGGGSSVPIIDLGTKSASFAISMASPAVFLVTVDDHLEISATTIPAAVSRVVYVEITSVAQGNDIDFPATWRWLTPPPGRRWANGQRALLRLTSFGADEVRAEYLDGQIRLSTPALSGWLPPWNGGLGFSPPIGDPGYLLESNAGGGWELGPKLPASVGTDRPMVTDGAGGRKLGESSGDGGLTLLTLNTHRVVTWNNYDDEPVMDLMAPFDDEQNLWLASGVVDAGSVELQLWDETASEEIATIELEAPNYTVDFAPVDLSGRDMHHLQFRARLTGGATSARLGLSVIVVGGAPD